MGTLTKALVYLASILGGMVVMFLATALRLRITAPCPAPCDAPAMTTAFSAVLIGPVVGLVIGYLIIEWVESRQRAKRR